MRGKRLAVLERLGEPHRRVPPVEQLREALAPLRERAVEKALKTPDCVIDGEVCALDEAGVPRFSLMQQGSPDTPIVYYVF
ncbi:MAG TPA: hypothetical protein VG079_03095, partial [Gaiellaceae bacterium]|nr:hypothetical protein [Gaiellaceae bacterium]